MDLFFQAQLQNMSTVLNGRAHSPGPYAFLVKTNIHVKPESCHDALFSSPMAMEPVK